MTMPALTCIHATSAGSAGLCDQCYADYQEDPEAFLEFGDHPEGLARWRELQAEMSEYAARQAALPTTAPDPTIPF